jgi:hypothetical protein
VHENLEPAVQPVQDDHPRRTFKGPGRERSYNGMTAVQCPPNGHYMNVKQFRAVHHRRDEYKTFSAVSSILRHILRQWLVRMCHPGRRPRNANISPPSMEECGSLFLLQLPILQAHAGSLRSNTEGSTRRDSSARDIRRNGASIKWKAASVRPSRPNTDFISGCRIYLG